MDQTNHTTHESNKSHSPWITQTTLPMNHINQITHESHKLHCPWITQITLPMNHTNQTTHESHKLHCPWVTHTTLPINHINHTTHEPHKSKIQLLAYQDNIPVFIWYINNNEWYELHMFHQGAVVSITNTHFMTNLHNYVYFFAMEAVIYIYII